MGDIVARLDPRARRRCLICRCHHANGAILRRHGQAKAAIFALRLGHQIFEIGHVQIGAVWIKAAEHTGNRALFCGALPEKREEHYRTEGRAEARPREGYDFEDYADSEFTFTEVELGAEDDEPFQLNDPDDIIILENINN